MSSELDRVKPVRFPTRWMTYKARIRSDVDRAYTTDGGPEFFNDEYVDKLAAQAKQLDEWLIKLFVVQTALTGFQIVGFVVSDASISLFGVTLKQAAGVKEVLLGFYCFVAIATWMVAVSRDTILAVLERLVELSTEQPLMNFSKLAAPTFFSMKFYFPRAYDDWIFPTPLNKVLFGALVFVGMLLFFAALLLSLAVNILFFVDVYRHPTLGVWSTVILSFVCLTVLFGVLFIVRIHVPLPYRDQSLLLELKALEESDPPLHRRQWAEIYGPQSTYRRYKRSYVVKLRLMQMKDAIFDICAKLWLSLQARLKRWRYRKSWRNRH
jgi:hypothetical protein